MQAMKLNEVRDVTKDQSSTTELELNPTVHGSHLQTLSKFNKLSEGTKEAKADIREQMDKLETCKEEQIRVNFQQQRNTTKRDRERLGQLYILGQRLSMMVQKLE